MSTAQAIAELMNALSGGVFCDLQSTEQGLQFRLKHPGKAARRGEGFQYFLCQLEGLRLFSLQPFKNADTVIDNHKQIMQLELRISRAEAAEGNLVKVWCALGKGSPDARLSIKAEAFKVWDEAFDQVSALDLA
jgi:hypothetical protein